MARSGLRAHTMTDAEQFGDQIKAAIEDGNRTLQSIYGQKQIEAESSTAQYVEGARRLGSYVGDAISYVQDALEAGKHVLCEGAQGTLLDIDHGLYPYVTSSSPTV